MGSNLSPVVAIIYMDHIERQVLEASRTRVWKRYMDDIFFISEDSPEVLLAKANTISQATQFTVEVPKDHSLAYLDVWLEHKHSRFLTSLYVKPIHSGHCLPADSWVSRKRKEGLMVNEFRRAAKISNYPAGQSRSFELLSNRFKMNGYRTRDIERARRLALQPPRRVTSREAIYLKVPYIDDKQEFEVRRAIKKASLPVPVRCAFSGNRPLSHLLRRSNRSPCPSGCLCDGRNLCLTKNIVYKIACSVCGLAYVGETGRTFQARMLEHVKCPSSQVYQHFLHHHGGPPTLDRISTLVLATSFHNTGHRKEMERHFIQKLNPALNPQDR